MGRPRTKNKGLPRGMYCRGGYYSYRDPLARKEYGLGRDKYQAYMQLRELLARHRESSDGLMTEDEISQSAQPVTDVCGIYFLLQGSTVVYVGQSISCHERIFSHRKGKKVFNRTAIIETPLHRLNATEAAYIKKFQPKFNVHYATVFKRANGEELETNCVLQYKPAEIVDKRLLLQQPVAQGEKA